MFESKNPTDTFIEAIARRTKDLLMEDIREELNRIVVEEKSGKGYFTPREAAQETHKSLSTIHKALQSGELKYLAQGRRYYIRREDLDEWMNELGRR